MDAEKILHLMFYTLAAPSLTLRRRNLNVRQSARQDNSLKIHIEKKVLCIQYEAHGALCCAGIRISSPSTVVDDSREMAMDLFQHRYYRLNKTLMTLIGQWPYQSISARHRSLGVIAFLSISQTIPLTLAIHKHRGDWKVLIDCALPCFFGAAYLTKYLGFMWNPQKTLKLISRIRTDWQVWAQDREVNILHQYAEHGKKMIIAYIAMNITNLVVFMSEPVVPKIIDVVMKNGTEPGKFPWPIDYYCLDVQKYYFFIMIHTFVCVSMVTMVLATSDAMLIIYVQHVCGIFAALGYAKFIEATYNWIFFFIIGLGMILINVLGLQILMTTTEPAAKLKFIVFALATTLHFYIECHIAQILMDHSYGVRFHINNSQWYKLSPKTQKLMQLMMLRCRKPCQLTAGKMFIMGARHFGLAIRTAMSYFTFVRSTQGL